MPVNQCSAVDSCKGLRGCAARYLPRLLGTLLHRPGRRQTTRVPGCTGPYRPPSCTRPARARAATLGTRYCTVDGWMMGGTSIPLGSCTANKYLCLHHQLRRFALPLPQLLQPATTTTVAVDRLLLLVGTISRSPSHTDNHDAISIQPNSILNSSCESPADLQTRRLTALLSNSSVKQQRHSCSIHHQCIKP